MLARTFTATIQGLKAIKIEVEVDGNRGTPIFIFIGLPSKATEEARQRITSALQNCGIRIRSKRTIVNLAPADLPKLGSTFDLAIAIGLLKMYGEISLPTDDTMFFGELALDGKIKRIRGALPLILAAKEMGFRHVIIPKENAPEVSIVSGIQIHPIKHLGEYITFSHRQTLLETVDIKKFTPLNEKNDGIDFADIYGQEQAKRAMMIAAAGGHNILLTGPPGSGKSMLARALISILPPLTEQEAIEVTNIHSICGLTTTVLSSRPFRSPHHTTSQSGLLGGGRSSKPGEISLAHHGVLFLDELLEFPRANLETLRQPLEEKRITITRAEFSATYPCAFLLVAATNPCPCGYTYSTKKSCSCPPGLVQRYQKQLSGPLLDRIDLRLQMTEVDVEKLNAKALPKTQTSSSMKEKVLRVREKQLARYRAADLLATSELTPTQIREFCRITPEAQKLLQHAAEKFALSARSYFKVMRVSQTIADLEDAEKVHVQHIAEALQYR